MTSARSATTWCAICIVVAGYSVWHRLQIRTLHHDVTILGAQIKRLQSKIPTVDKVVNSDESDAQRICHPLCTGLGSFFSACEGDCGGQCGYQDKADCITQCYSSLAGLPGISPKTYCAEECANVPRCLREWCDFDYPPKKQCMEKFMQCLSCYDLVLPRHQAQH